MNTAVSIHPMLSLSKIETSLNYCPSQKSRKKRIFPEEQQNNMQQNLRSSQQPSQLQFSVDLSKYSPSRLEPSTFLGEYSLQELNEHRDRGISL